VKKKCKLCNCEAATGREFHIWFLTLIMNRMRMA